MADRVPPAPRATVTPLARTSPAPKLIVELVGAGHRIGSQEHGPAGGLVGHRQVARDSCGIGGHSSPAGDREGARSVGAEPAAVPPACRCRSGCRGDEPGSAGRRWSRWATTCGCAGAATTAAGITTATATSARAAPRRRVEPRAGSNDGGLRQMSPANLPEGEPQATRVKSSNQSRAQSLRRVPG